MEPNKKLIQSYVFTEEGAYFVSTIDRESSSMMGGRYAETLVWEWDTEERERGGIVAQGEDLEGSIHRHMQIVEKIYSYGLVGLKEAEV